MLTGITEVIIINLYWFSYIFIGYACLRFIAQNKFFKSLNNVANEVIRYNLFTTVFVSLLITACLLAPISTIFYITGANIKWAVLAYLIAIFLSVSYVIAIYSKANLAHMIRRVLSNKWAVLFFFILCIDYVLSVYLKSYALFEVDTYYHLTRITHMLSTGYFSSASGYYSNIPDVSYPISLIYTLYIIPSKLFSYTPLDIWGLSFGFFRLIQWTMIFTLSYLILRRIGKNDRTTAVLSYLSVFVAMALNSYHFFIATYPNQIVIVWIAAIILLLLKYTERPSRLMLLLMMFVALLITTTHSTYALMAALFIPYWYCIQLIINARHNQALLWLKSSWSLVFIVAILMVGPIITKMMPSFITADQDSLGSSDVISIYNDVVISSPWSHLPKDYVQWISLALSIVGLVYLCTKLYKRKSFGVVIALVSFSSFIFYFPPVFTIISDILPVWVIDRFTAMNILKFILPAIGIIFISKLITLRIEKKVNYKNALTVLLSVIVLAIAAPYTYGLLLSTKQQNHHTYGYISAVQKSLSPIIEKDSRVLSDDRTSYSLPAIIPVNVVSVAFGHSTISADAANRSVCKEEVLRTFKYSDLSLVGIDYVILSEFNRNTPNSLEVVKTKKYLKYMTKEFGLSIYRVDNAETEYNKNDVHPACTKFIDNERSN